MDRNAWFQRVAAHTVMRAPEEHGIVFAYSYAAERVFAAAKARGWPTVLGQIDPGLSEAQLVADLYKLAGQVHEHIPSAYWESWRRETALADLILVNSEWSRQGLLNEGVAPDKIVVVPLAYESQKVTSPKETSPTFRSERPLRLLFLGQVTLRKGIDIVLDAMALLPDLPLRLDVVGPLQIQIPETATVDERIIFHGAVPRSKAAEFYSAADIFLFPTRSDGFGLTQLEALSAGVPIISSDRCGAVVEDGKNGFVLQNLEPKALADLIAFLLHSPSLVQALSDGATLSDRFSIDRLGSRLMSLSSQYFNVV
ncbi:glycosyltransferase family 4 protein [Marivita geojedonensis]|nr:glycosyltransferase family 4 protein [Marivita geojedonensis]